MLVLNRATQKVQLAKLAEGQTPLRVGAGLYLPPGTEGENCGYYLPTEPERQLFFESTEELYGELYRWHYRVLNQLHSELRRVGANRVECALAYYLLNLQTQALELSLAYRVNRSGRLPVWCFPNY